MGLEPVDFGIADAPEEAEGWQDLLDEELYTEDKSWTKYDDHEGFKPHQGWKIHISADPVEGREVVEAVLPYLQENSIRHKIVSSPDWLQDFKEGREGGQQGKLFTVYPCFDPGKKEEVAFRAKDQEGVERPFQYFKPGDEEFNRESINVNVERTSQLIEDLQEELSEAGLLRGPEIPGHNGEEFQVGDTRVHCRYANFTHAGYMKKPDGSITRPEGNFEELDKEAMINARGEVESKKLYPQPVEAAEKPF